MPRKFFCGKNPEKRRPDGHESKVQPDLKTLMFLQRQGQFMFLIPKMSRNQTFCRIIGIICTIALIPISYKMLSLRFDYFSRLPITCLVMDIANFYLGFVYIAAFFINQNYCLDNCQKLENIVSRTEALLKSTSFVVSKDKFLWKYAFMHLVYLFIHGIQMYKWISMKQGNLILSYIGFRIFHYLATFPAILIYQWLGYLCRRYNHIDKYLKYIFSKRVLVVQEVVGELRLTAEIYKNLTDISYELTNIFSMHLFFLVFISIMVTLHGLSYAVVLIYSASRAIQSVIFVGAFFANILALIISYEGLREKSLNAIKTCLFLQEEMIQGQLRNELRSLTKYMKKLQPKMSAVGYFEMDFQLIAGYISIVFTYLIIIFQFNITFV